MMIKHSLAIFFCCLLALCAVAQNNDAVLWTGFSVQKKLNKKLSAEIEQQFRLTNNYSYISNIFTEAAIMYKISKQLRITGNYRFSNKYTNELGHFVRNRVNLDVAYRGRIQYFSIQFRTRFQSTSDFDGTDLLFRNKLGVAYREGKKLTPAIYIETFSPINSGESDATITQYRLGTTYSYQLSKSTSIGYGFIFEHEIDRSIQRRNYISSFSLGYRF